jgi:DeoR/GlpR family transcriptional regulator of sugar metabolism
MTSPKDIATESGAPMIPEQRRELMLRQLRKHQVLSIHQLMEMFDCSHMTIRRDIALLEQEGRAYSVSRGVRIASQLHSEPSHQLKAVVELSQKQVMAKLASRLLHANMTIYLDAGTSMLEIAPYIRVLSGMTVVTNDFDIVQALIESPMSP